MQVTPGFYQCPRCLKRDVYFAKRQVGQIGNLIDLPNGVANPAISMGVEKDVALCRECGERANWIPEKIHYTPEELADKKNKNFKTQWKIATILMFGTAGWTYFQISSMSLSANDLSTARLFYVCPLIAGFFCAYKGWKK